LTIKLKQPLFLIKKVDISTTGVKAASFENPLNRDCKISAFSIYSTKKQPFAAWEALIRPPDQKYVYTFARGIATPSGVYDTLDISWNGAVYWPQNWDLIIAIDINETSTLGAYIRVQVEEWP